MASVSWAGNALAQASVYQVGRGGLSWTDLAEVQTGVVENDGSLQPLELTSGQNLITCLASLVLRGLKDNLPILQQ